MHDKSLKVLFVTYAVLWIGGVVSYTIYGGPATAENWTAAAFLWVAGLITLFSSGRSFSLPLVLASAAALAIEIFGVSTGKVFGSYEYTDALGFRLLGAPIVIAMAWCIFLGYVWHGTSYLRYGVLVRAMVGALWMTGLDLLVDPLAAGSLAYWRWIGGGWYEGIPLSNFAGWFVVSFMLLVFLHQRQFKNGTARAVGLSVLLFFTALAALRAIFIPAMVGIGLMIVDISLLPREHEDIVRRLQSLISRKSMGLSLFATFMLFSLSQTQPVHGDTGFREQFRNAKQMLREGSALNDEALVRKGYELLKSAHAQSPGTTTLFFVAQAELELVRLGLDSKDQGMYDQFIDGALEKAKEVVQQRKEWSEGYALLSSLHGYSIAHNALNAITAGPKASGSAEEAVRLDSANPRAWLVRGIVKLNTPWMFGGDKKEAVANLLRAVELFEQRPKPEWDEPEWGSLDALLWLGWAYEQVDRSTDAYTSYKRAISAELRATWIRTKFLEPLERKLAEGADPSR